MKAVDKFAIIEKNIEGIFESMLDVTSSKSQRLNKYLENKHIIDSIKSSLEHVSCSDDVLVAGRAKDLLSRVELNLAAFGESNLDIETKEPVEGTPVKAVDALTRTESTKDEHLHEDSVLSPSNSKRSFMFIKDDIVVNKMNCTRKELLGYINANYREKSDLPSIVEYNNVKVSTKVVYDI